MSDKRDRKVVRDVGRCVWELNEAQVRASPTTARLFLPWLSDHHLHVVGSKIEYKTKLFHSTFDLSKSYDWEREFDPQSGFFSLVDLRPLSALAAVAIVG